MSRTSGSVCGSGIVGVRSALCVAAFLFAVGCGSDPDSGIDSTGSVPGSEVPGSEVPGSEVPGSGLPGSGSGSALEGCEQDTDCGEQAYCAREEGECRPWECEPDTLTCEGDTVVVCDASGRIEATEVCAETEACAANTFGCSCLEGACLARECTPGTLRCAGRGTQACDADGLQWGETVPCGGSETCVAGACLPVACSPNSVLCVADVLVTCDETGTERTEENCASRRQVCRESGDSASCEERVCVPDEVRCSEDGTLVIRCDARGAEETEAECPAGAFCQPGGICVAVRTCEEARCAVVNRVCEQPDPQTDAACGPCLDGFEESGRSCVPVEPGVGLGEPCTSDRQCPSAAWCPTDTVLRRCAPRPEPGGVEMPFQWLPAGPFTMGSPAAELGRASNETQVPVTLTRDLFVQRTPVTQAQWAAVMSDWNTLSPAQRQMTGWPAATPAFGTTPSCFRSPGETVCTTTGSNPTAPVERVSWWDAVVFANTLSLLEGLTPCYTLTDCGTGAGVDGVGGGCSGTTSGCMHGTFTCAGVSFAGLTCTGYRLLTEAEWEYAARAGTTTATYGGNLAGPVVSTCNNATHQPNLNPIAWWCLNSGGSTRPVGQRTANAFGLYDMLGQVWEWVWTWSGSQPVGGTDPLGPASGSERVIRGGSWSNSAQDPRAARREGEVPVYRSWNHGFRLARTVSP